MPARVGFLFGCGANAPPGKRSKSESPQPLLPRLGTPDQAPREDRDLFIAASNGHVLAFDNVSGLPGWISDTLCRLATGGGFAVRQLYTDQDEVLFDAARPVILNGIEEIVTRAHAGAGGGLDFGRPRLDPCTKRAR
jgi:hypothetical protein